MKKIRIISLLLIVVLIAGLFAGCGSKVKKEELEKDPASYIQEGWKTSLKASPLGDLLDIEDPEAINIAMGIDAGDEGSIKADATIGLNELSILCNVDVNIEGTDIDAAVFIDKENLALKLAELEEIFGTDAVGVSLKDFVSNLKASAWYDMLVAVADSEGIDLDALSEEDVNSIVDTMTKTIEDIEKLANDCTDYQITETEIEAGGKKVKCFKIEQTLSKDADEKIMTAMKDIVEGILTATGEYDEDEIAEAVEEATEEMRESLSAMINMTTSTYYIAQANGAMIQAETTIKVEGEEMLSATINFGANPTKTFAPTMTMTINDEYGDTYIVDGSTSIDKSSKSMTFKFDISEKTEDGKELVGDMKLTLGKDNKYTLTVTPVDEESQSLKGEFSVKDSKLHFTIDLGSIEEADTEGIVSIDIDFNAKAPAAFKYDDLLKWDEDKVEEFLSQLGF